MHFALVGQVRADIEHVPGDLVADWHQQGPLRVQRLLADRLERLRDRGELRADDIDRATLHFIALVTAESTVRPPGAPALNPASADAAVVAGVDAFLDGHRAR